MYDKSKNINIWINFSTHSNHFSLDQLILCEGQYFGTRIINAKTAKNVNNTYCILSKS